MKKNRKRVERIDNPVFGILPLFVYAVCLLFADGVVALVSGLVVSLMGWFLAEKSGNLLYLLSAMCFLVVLSTRFFYPSFGTNEMQSLLMTECLMLLFLIVEKLFSVKSKNKRGVASVVFLCETQSFILQIIVGLALHLCLTWGAIGIWGSNITVAASAIILLILLSVMFFVELCRLRLLKSRFYDEEWLSVVDEHGNVTGKVAKSVTKELKNRFMHPVVRVALIHKGKLYLKKRSASHFLNQGMLDYPFEKYLIFRHDVDEAVHNVLKREIGDDILPYRFLLKYVFENDATKRLIFLYVSQVDDEDEFARLRLKDGKLWTVAQIDDNLGMNVFSENFELEFEYLRNTVLLSYAMR